MTKLDRIRQDLDESIAEENSRMELLRRIDRETARGETPLPEALEDIALRLKAMMRAGQAEVFLVAYNQEGPRLRSFDIGRDRPGPVIFLPQHATPHLPDEVEFTREWPVGERLGTLLIPIHWRSDPFALLVLRDGVDAENPKLSEQDTIDYCRGIADQLTVLVKNRMDGHIEAVKQRLILAFFEHQLRPTACWAAIADMVPKFLPDWRPLALPSAPRVQLLTLPFGPDREKGGKGAIRYLILSADDQERSFQTRPLRVDQTVTGLLIEMNDRERTDELSVNPRDYLDRYQSYLFEEIPQSELVLTIRHKGEIRGLLNLEHPFKDAFISLHVRILADAARFLGPFVDALVARNERQRSKEFALLHVQSNLLKRMASTFRHKVGQSIMEGRFALEKIERVVDGTALPAIGHLRQAINDFYDRSNSFLDDLPEFIFPKKIDVFRIVDDAKKEFHFAEMAQGIRMELLDKGEGHHIVWASRLLREHFYNLLKNSVDAVRTRLLANQITEGIITITISKKPMIDLRDRETSAPLILIKIEDNGGGVDPQYEDRIFDFGYTTKKDSGGSGFGISAAREYAQNFNGDLYIEKNDFGVGLSLVVALQEYTPNYHEALTRIMLDPNARSGE